MLGSCQLRAELLKNEFQLPFITSKLMIIHHNTKELTYLFLTKTITNIYAELISRKQKSLQVYMNSD